MQGLCAEHSPEVSWCSPLACSLLCVAVAVSLQTRVAQESLYDAEDKLLAKHEDAMHKAEALRRALKKGPNHQMETAAAAAQAQMKLLQHKVDRLQAEVDAGIDAVRQVAPRTTEVWWQALHGACVQRNNRLQQVTHDAALSHEPQSVDVMSLSVRSCVEIANTLRSVGLTNWVWFCAWFHFTCLTTTAHLFAGVVGRVPVQDTFVARASHRNGAGGAASEAERCGYSVHVSRVSNLS